MVSPSTVSMDPPVEILPADATQVDSSLAPGQMVTLNGLAAAPELNGAHGTLLFYDKKLSAGQSSSGGIKVKAG